MTTVRIRGPGAAMLLAAALCVGCGPGDLVETPLLDGHHVPDVLTEGRSLEAPPSLAGNRILSGWWPWRRRGTVWYVPQGRARLEVASLSGRERLLRLHGEDNRRQPEDRVMVRIGDREQLELPVAAPLEVPLPAGLPPGRVPVELVFPEEAQFAVEWAEVEGSLPPGEVRFEEGRIVQGGDSLVDIVRPAPPGSRLRGRFEPPAAPRGGQRFALLAEREEAAPETLFEWRPGFWSRWRGRRSLELRLPGGKGVHPDLARIRLLSRGQGPPAVWRDLRLAAPAAPAPPAASPPPAPRLVVLYVLDALRADHLGHLGGPPGATPTLDRLAAGGVTFTRHLSVAPNTLPSTKSLFSGQPFIVRGHARLPEDGPETLAEAFAAAGYRTAAISGNGYVSATYGLTRGFEHVSREAIFQEYEDRPGAYNANAEQVHAAALAWLDELGPGDKAFVYAHTIHPHNPYDPPEPFRGRFAGDAGSALEASTGTLLGIQHNRVEISPADEEKIRGLYAGGLAYNDARLAGFLDELARRFPPAETLVVVTSDHGEELFDHGGVLHGYTLYREQLHVPLVLWWPERLAPRRVEAATDNLDLHAALRLLIGAAPAGGDGAGLWRLALGAQPPAAAEPRFAAAASLKGGLFMAQSDRLKLVLAPRTDPHWGMGEGRGRSRDPEYLFDLVADPGETRNLAGQASLEAAWLRSRLVAWVERWKLAEAGAEEPEPDEETRRRLQALGYLE